MPHGDVGTFHQDGKWGNRVEGESVLPGENDTKEPAVSGRPGRGPGAEVEHIIRNFEGTIGERNTYGHDPRDIPG